MSHQEQAERLLDELKHVMVPQYAVAIVTAALDAAAREAGLSLSVQNDALGISELLDDSTRERQMYHKLVYDIRKALPDALDVPLLELPNAIRAALDAAAREALLEAAEEWPHPFAVQTVAGSFVSVQNWLQARADSLSGRHEEDEKKANG